MHTSLNWNNYFISIRAGCSDPNFPAVAVKINSENLSDITTKEIGDKGVGDLTYVESQDMIYAYGANGKVFRVDPNDLSNATVINTGLGSSQHGSITNDGKYLYTLSWGYPSHVMKWNLSDYSLVADLTLTDITQGHNIKYDNETGYLFATAAEGHVAKIPTSLASFTATSGLTGTHTDDMAILPGQLWVGSETYNNITIVNKTDLSYDRSLEVGITSFGVFYGLGKIWYLSGYDPVNEIIIIDPVTHNQTHMYVINDDFGGNEMSFFPDKIMYTGWCSPSYGNIKILPLKAFSNFTNLNHALIYFNNYTLCGSTSISDNNGNITCYYNPTHSIYLLDNYNITEGVPREDDPLWIASKDIAANQTDYHLGSNLTETISNVQFYPENAPCPNAVYLYLDNGTTILPSFSCSDGNLEHVTLDYVNNGTLLELIYQNLSVTIISPINTTYIFSIPVNITLNIPGDCVYSIDNGTTNNTMTADSLHMNFNATYAPPPLPGNYTLHAYCSDMSGSANNTESVDFTVAIIVCPANMSGSNTTESPCMITNCTQLQNMSLMLANNYALANDIDCSETATWNGVEGFNPVGNSTSPFTGTFDGMNHTINNLYINHSSTDYVGLFGYIKETTLVNVGLTNVSISGQNYTAGLVGYTANPGWVDAYLDEVYATGVVSGRDNIGGLVGYGYAIDITNSYFIGNVSGHDAVGSLMGAYDYSYSNGIRYSYASGNVSLNGSGGSGLSGVNDEAVVYDSYTTSEVYGSSVYAIGNNLGGVSNVYWYDWPDDDVTECADYWECNRINDTTGGIPYFFNVSNEPMLSWDFDTVWDAFCNGSGYPILKWQGLSDVRECSGYTCTLSLVNTSWGPWTDNSSCYANDSKRQVQNRTQYDANHCGEIENTTFYNYTWVSCDYCTPSLVNTTPSAWYNISACYSNDTIRQECNWTRYDEHHCGEVENETFYNYTWTACNYESPELSWDWTDINSTIPFNYTTVCVSASEDVNCTIYFNGTGYANDTTGTNICWDMTDLAEGNYTANATCQDSFSNLSNTSNAWMAVNMSMPYCGDGICNNGETCSSCEEDCGACHHHHESCDEEWECSDWSECVDGKQTRECDCDCPHYRDCTGDHDEERSCAPCTEEWSCTTWSDCVNGRQSRVCVCHCDDNDCSGDDSETRACTVPCTASWSCTEWGDCDNGTRTRDCTCSCADGKCSGNSSESQGCRVPVTEPEITVPESVEQDSDVSVNVRGPNGAPLNGTVVITAPDGMAFQASLIGGKVDFTADKPGDWTITYIDSSGRAVTKTMTVVGRSGQEGLLLAENASDVKGMGLMKPSSKPADYTWLYAVIIVAVAVFLIFVYKHKRRRSPPALGRPY